MAENLAPNHDIFFVYKNKWTNIIFAIYVYLGGVLFEKSCGFKLKTIYFLANASNFILGIVSAMVCFHIFLRNRAPLMMFFNYSFSFNGPMIMFIIDFLIYSCREDIRAALEIIDRDFDIKWEDKKRDYENGTTKTFDLTRYFSLIVVVDVFSTILVLYSRYVYVVILGDEQMLRNHLSYILAYPFADKMNSFETYTIVYWIQSVLFCAIIIKGSMMPIMTLIICGLYYNQFINLARSMDYDSAKMEEFMERLYADTESTLNVSEMTRIERSINITFSRQFIRYLQIHRTLLKYTERIRGFVETCFSLGVVVSLVVYIPGGYIVMQANTPIVLKISLIGLFPLVTFVFFICCYCAKLFDDANAALISAIYGTPWYYFSSETGKFVYLFLCEIQHTPIQFFVFKIFPVTMSSFPRILQFNYSVLNVLRRRTFA